MSSLEGERPAVVIPGTNNGAASNHDDDNEPSPSPGYVTVDAGNGTQHSVERTPFNVVKWGLDDPFPNRNPDRKRRYDEDDDDVVVDVDIDADGSSVSDDSTNLVEAAQGEVVGFARAHQLLSDLYRPKYWRYRLREVTVTFDGRYPESMSTEQMRHDYTHTFGRFAKALEDYMGIRDLHLTRGNFWAVEEEEEAPHFRLRRHVVREEAGGNGNEDDTDDDYDDDDDDDDDSSNDDDDDEDDSRADSGFNPLFRLKEEDLEFFFGTALGKHLSLEEITITHSRIQTRYWRIFTEGCDYLRGLTLTATALDAECCRLLQQMIRRSGLLDELKIENCNLGSEEWRGMCEAIADNPRVDSVTLIEQFGNVVVGKDTLLPLLRRTSGVETLVVHANSWSVDDGAFEAFVKGLRTNERLRELTLYCFRHREIPDLQLMEGLLTTYNWTLKTVTVRSCSDIGLWRSIRLLLDRNRGVRAALGNRDDTDDDTDDEHQLPPRLPHEAPLWPLVLNMYRRFPTLPYRFVRIHNLEAVIEQARRAASAISRKKRSHTDV